MTCRPVSRRVGNVKNNDPSLIEPIAVYDHRRAGASAAGIGRLSDAVLARLIEQVVEVAESLDGKRAGRFQEHLENARPVAPDKRISAPCIHAIFPLPG
jgi:hypothetical protein